jgi:hypothetical protein
MLLEDPMETAHDRLLPPAEAGELSEKDLEVVVGGLSRAWVDLPQVSAPTTTPLVACHSPAALKASGV